jgi:cell volume regulation protein A
VTVSLPSDLALAVGAALLVAGVLCAGFADRLRAPGLVLFLALGMVLGTDGLGLIDFADAGLAQSIGVAALVVILYEGGLSTSPGELRRVAGSGLALATVGVVVTALVVAGGTLLVLDVPATTALLIGAVVSSTDAAAVFSVLRPTPLPARLKVLLEAESGGQRPHGGVAYGGVPGGCDRRGQHHRLGGVRPAPARGRARRGHGGGLGGKLGPASSAVGEPGAVPGAGLGVAGLAYGGGALLGTSGFLAAYVAGVVVGAGAPRWRRAVRTFHEGLASTAQIALFLLLGLLVFPARLPSVALAALAVAAILVFVARPLAVAVVLPWFGFSRREVVFASWAGLRGAVPIVLATFPLTVGHPDGQLIFNVTFFVVLVSVAVQGLTVSPLARRLGLRADGESWGGLAEVIPLDAVGIDVVEISVPTGSPVVGRLLREVPLPLGARVAAIVRSGEVMVPDGDSRLAESDFLVVFGRRRGELAEAITAWAQR